MRRHRRRLLTAAMWVGLAAATPAPPVAVAQPAAQRSGIDPVDLARAWRRDHGAEILSSFAEFLAIPNVASDGPNIQRNAEHLAAELDRRGVRSELWRLEGAPPVVFGELAAPGARRTLGIYAHYDGQPVEISRWLQPPWSPTLYTAAFEQGGVPRPLPAPGEAIDPEWRLYARSAGDDKAPIVALLAALDALRAARLTPTSNLVLLFEGEEEAGSDHLGEYLRRHRERLRADVWLIFDGPVHQSRRPQLVFGVRGYTGLDITVFGATRYLHSGHYGNWAPNPAMTLARLLASMKDDEGRVLVPGFYDSTEPVSAAERRVMASLPSYDDELRSELGLAATEAGNAPLAERLLLPSLNIRGLVSAAVGDEARNVIPTTATASIDIRLAKGNDPEDMLDLVEAHIRRQGFLIVRDEPDAEVRRRHPRIARVTRRAGYPAARTSMELPVVGEISAAALRASTEPLVLLPTLGGSLPLYLFDEMLAAPVVITPIANHDNNQHAPNENLRIANLWYGIDLLTAILTLPGPAPDQDLQDLAAWLTGSFSSAARAEADPEGYFDIRLVTVPVWRDRDDGPWLYVEQAAAEAVDRPYRQRFYRLSRAADGRLLSEVFTLPGEPLDWAGAWREPESLSRLRPEDLLERPGCSISLERTGPSAFAGSTGGKDCPSSLRGSTYATSEVVVSPDRVITWDRGFDAEGRQVWGAREGPYLFDRTPRPDR